MSTIEASFEPERRAFADIFKMEDFDLLGRMTLLLVILYNQSYGGEFSLVILTVGVLGMVFSGLLRSERYWFVVAAAQSVWVVMNYTSMDDHKYLLAYWLIAIWLVVREPEENRQELLSWNARILLGLTMAFATLWKGVLSAEYMDSAFFHMTILSDFRFEHVIALFGALDPQILQQNQEALTSLEQSVHNGLPIREVVLTSSASVGSLAYLVTYSTVLLEAGLAVLMLIPGQGNILTWLRHLGLLTFLATTYWAVPVVGFGWLLIILGLAMCPSSLRALRWTYIILFFAIQIRIYLL